MPKWNVVWRLAAHGSEQIEIEAANEMEAKEGALRIARRQFDAGELQLEVMEITTENCTKLADDNPPAPDPSRYTWIRMADAKHPLPEGALIFSRNGEMDEDDEVGERETGPNVIGVIDRAHYNGPQPGYPEKTRWQHWTYDVHFRWNGANGGVYVTIDAGEYDAQTGTAPDDYLVALDGEIFSA